jgi:cobalamin biosynthesis Mg chelatase CobN
MSKHTRALVLTAIVAAMNLAGLTAVAQAQANDQPTSTQDARRPPTERQVGEPRRHGSVASPHTGSVDAKHRALVERSRSARHGQVASQEQTAADAALRRLLARERSSIPNGTPAQMPTPVSAEPSRQPGWLVASLGVLAAVLALVAGLAVLAVRRAGRRTGLGHAA